MNGGPAFLATVKSKYVGDYQDVLTPGMSLLDYFAGQALAGLSAIPDERRGPSNRLNKIDKWRDELVAADAKSCYTIARAMLVERNKL